jgi:hypothetical protein
MLYTQGSARYLVPEGATLKILKFKGVNFDLGPPFEIFFQKIFPGLHPSLAEQKK